MTRRRVIGGIAVLTVMTVVAGFFLLQPRVTQANFDRLEVGMSVEEVEGLLGPADLSQPMKGLVIDPTTFLINLEQEVRGQGDYDYRQWASAELTVSGVFEQGRLVCRYKGEPHVRPWYARLWRAVMERLP